MLANYLKTCGWRDKVREVDVANEAKDTVTRVSKTWLHPRTLIVASYSDTVKPCDKLRTW